MEDGLLHRGFCGRNGSLTVPWEPLLLYRLVEIIFPKGMVTQQGKELPLRQGMQAMVEVVTDERRLIELLLPLSRE